MRSIGADPKEWPKEPFEDLEPLRQLIADLRSEKDKQHHQCKFSHNGHPKNHRLKYLVEHHLRCLMSCSPVMHLVSRGQTAFFSPFLSDGRRKKRSADHHSKKEKSGLATRDYNAPIDVLPHCPPPPPPPPRAYMRL